MGIIRGSAQGRDLAEQKGGECGKRGRCCLPAATLLTALTGHSGPAWGGKRLPAALGGLSDGCVCCSTLHLRMAKTLIKISW